MADPILDEVNAITQFFLYPQAIEDEFFRNSPFTAYLRSHSMATFTGGSDMRFAFTYAPLIGGAYSQGETFNVTKPQTLTAAQFQPKFYYTNITEYLEQIRVINVGDAAKFSLVEADLKQAMNTISAIIAIALHRDGQSAARIRQLNGWNEAFNDGVNPDWTGNVWTTYGGQTRNGAIGAALNSTPRWAGDAAGNAAPITYQLLEETYQDATRGGVEPNLGVGNKRVYAGIKNRIQPAQRFNQERDPYFGVSGMRMNNAMILKDDYFPSLRYGANNSLGNYLTSTFATPATITSASGLPAAGTTVTVGEVFNWFNTTKHVLYYAADPLFGFGFTGFKQEIDNTRVAGQILAMVNHKCTAPWSGISIYGLSN
jgi:hypothetical protein